MGDQGVGVECAPGGERLLRERRRPAGAGGVRLVFHGDAVPAGLDTYRWLDADVVRPRIPFQPGAIRWSDALAQDHCIDGSMLSEIRHD